MPPADWRVWKNPIDKLADEIEFALGILSAPENSRRRDALRSTWMKLLLPRHKWAVRFVVRSGYLTASSPDRPADLDSPDVVPVNTVGYNWTRVRAPVLLLFKWLAHAQFQYPHAEWIGKADDDVWLQPDAVAAQLAAVAARKDSLFAYVGNMQFSSWLNHRVVGFGYHLFETKVVKGAVGPFPFASGYFAVLSATLVDELLESRAADDAAQYRTLRLPKSRWQGVYEDVWLGSAIHRFASSVDVKPLVLVDLGHSGAISDSDGMLMTTNTAVWHSRLKRPERMLQVHARFAEPTGCLLQPGPLRCRKERGLPREGGPPLVCTFNRTRCDVDRLVFVPTRSVASGGADGSAAWRWVRCRDWRSPLRLSPSEIRAARACGLRTAHQPNRRADAASERRSTHAHRGRKRERGSTPQAS